MEDSEAQEVSEENGMIWDIIEMIGQLVFEITIIFCVLWIGTPTSVLILLCTWYIALLIKSTKGDGADG